MSVCADGVCACLYCDEICGSNKFAVNIGLQNAHIKLHTHTHTHRHWLQFVQVFEMSEACKISVHWKATKHFATPFVVLQPLNRLISDPATRRHKSKTIQRCRMHSNTICNTVHSGKWIATPPAISRCRDSLIHTYIILNGNVATQTKESILNGNWSGFWYVTRSARINSCYEAFTHFHPHTLAPRQRLCFTHVPFQTYLLTHPSSFRIHSLTRNCYSWLKEMKCVTKITKRKEKKNACGVQEFKAIHKQ